MLFLFYSMLVVSLFLINKLIKNCYMKNKTIDLFLLFCAIFMIASCGKSEDDFTVYRPPNQAISFSDVTDLIIDSSGKTIHVKAKIAAQNGLQKVEVIYQPWSQLTTVSTFSDPKSFSLDQPITIPANAALQIHPIVIKATDKNGQTSFMEVKVGLQNLNYDKLYLADVTDAAALSSDLFGVPMVMDKVGSHSYELVYYARSAGVKIRFLPNKAALLPVAIGKAVANPQRLSTDGATSLPIELGAKGYYKISVNTLLLSYTVEPFTPTGTAFNQTALVGRGFYDYPSMNWQNTLPDIILLDKDPDNPLLFTKKVKLGIPPGQTYTTGQFIITTNNGWTDFWRVDNAASPEIAVFNGGTNAEIPITDTPVEYLFVFDTYTNRIQAIKQ
jgi:hypothetical protein